jgi:hypothetical protein
MPRTTNASLSSAAQTKLDGLFKAHGTGGVAKRLRLTPDIVERLVYGGRATANAVERVEAALSQWEGS